MIHTMETEWNKNEASSTKWTLRLSPERNIELAPSRVSFSDTPPDCV